MNRAFLQERGPLLTVMMQCAAPETVIYRVRNGLAQGAEAFGLQVESMKPEFKTEEVFKRLFSEMQGKPCYVTNYRSGYNRGKTDYFGAGAHNCHKFKFAHFTPHNIFILYKNPPHKYGRIFIINC